MLTFILLVGCAGEQSVDRASHEPGAPSSSDTSFDYDIARDLTPRTWGRIADLELLGDSVLVVLDGYGPPFVSLIDLTDGSVTAVFGEPGRGPGELLAPHEVIRGIGPKAHIWVYDFNPRQFTRFDLDPAPTYRETIRLARTAIVTDPFWTDQGLVAGGLLFDRALVLVSDSQMRGPNRFAGIPPYGREDVEAQAFMQANEYLIALSPDRSKLALAFKYAPELQVIDIHALRTIHRFKTPDRIGFPRTLTGAGVTMFALQNSDLAFAVAIAATEDGVWVGYCGCKGTQVLGASAPGVHKLQFYDWNRGFRREIDLRRPISAVAASEDGSHLYVGVHDPEPMVLDLRRQLDESKR